MGLFKKKTEEEKQEQRQLKLNNRLRTSTARGTDVYGYFFFYPGNLDHMKADIEEGADPVCAISLAVEAKFIDGLKLLLSSAIRTKDNQERYDYALSAAVRLGYVDIVELLLKYGADPNGALSEGRNTLLHRAAKEGKGDIVKLLIAYGANVDAQNEAMDTPADVANSSGLRDYILKYTAKKTIAVQGDDAWALTTSDTVVHTWEDKSTGVRLTESFNFTTRKRHVTSYKADGDILAQELKTFDDIQQDQLSLTTAVAIAEAQLKKLGGIVPKT